MSVLPTDPGFDFRAAWYEGEVEGKDLLDAIDTLRAQLEAAESEIRTRREDYATLTDLWKSDEARYVARAEAAEAECVAIKEQIGEQAERLVSVAQTMCDGSDELWSIRAHLIGIKHSARTKEETK